MGNIIKTFLPPTTLGRDQQRLMGGRLPVEWIGSGEIFGYLRFPLINTLAIDFPQPFESDGSVGGKQSTDAETVGQNSETH